MNKTRNKGVTLVYAAIAMVVLMGFLSLAVDFGRVQLSKTQLQHAVDAAAGYAVNGLSDNTAVAKAQSVAAENNVDSTALALLSSDVEVGVWDSDAGTFTATSTSPNAVRVTGRRSAARGTAVPLFFGQVIGRRSQDISATSIALLSPDSKYNTAILNSITMSGNAQLQKDAGSNSVLTVASNGSYNFTNNAKIVGNVFYNSTAPAAGNVTGNISKMSSPLSFPSVSVPSGATALGALNWNSNRTVSGGTYYCTSLNFTNGTATLTGNVSIYCTGNISISSNAKFDTKNGSYQLKIYQTGSSPTFTYSSNNSLYAAIYAPTCNITMSGNGTIVGSMVGKTLTMGGNSTFCVSPSLPIPVAGSGGTCNRAQFVKSLPSVTSGSNTGGCHNQVGDSDDSHCRSYTDDDDDCNRSSGYSQCNRNSFGHDEDDDDDHYGNCHSGSGCGWQDYDDDNYQSSHGRGHGCRGW